MIDSGGTYTIRIRVPVKGVTADTVHISAECEEEVEAASFNPFIFLGSFVNTITEPTIARTAVMHHLVRGDVSIESSFWPVENTFMIRYRRGLDPSVGTVIPASFKAL